MEAGAPSQPLRGRLTHSSLHSVPSRPGRDGMAMEMSDFLRESAKEGESAKGNRHKGHKGDGQGNDGGTAPVHPGTRLLHRLCLSPSCPLCSRRTFALSLDFAFSRRK